MKLIWIFILVLVFRNFINPSDNSKVISNNSTVQTEYDGNDYKKFTGEKILIGGQSEELEGEWGELSLTPFIIEPTAGFLREESNIDDSYNMFESSSQWTFKDKSLQEIRAMFLQTGLDKSACDELIANTAAAKDFKGFITTPPDVVLWSLTAENRAELYPVIGKDSYNALYNQPLYYNSSNSGEWLYDSGLSEEIQEKLKKLIYIVDGISYISDIHLILPSLNNNEEKVRLLQLLYRTRALDVQLKIHEGQDVSRIADYWGKFGRKELIEPLLKRISSTRGGGEVDISELLPEIPQSRLNTYSGLVEFETDWKDCHWTTINFFNKEADESYYNVNDMLSPINEISELAGDSALEFGDVVSIFNENNELTHSCTYIADNLVLTKNGMGNLHPFVITYLYKTVPLYGDKAVYYSRTVGDTHSIDLENIE